MKLTKEQEDILHSAKNMNAGDILIVNALAGCAKTTTLKKIAEDNPDNKFLYLAFNRAIVEEAKKRFPENTKATTLHGLARGYEGRKEIKALSLDLVSKILGKNISNKNEYFKVFNSLKVYEKFCNSHFSISELEDLKNEIKEEMKQELSNQPNIKDSKWIIEQRTKMIPKVPEIHQYILDSNFTIFGTFLKEFVDSADSRTFNYDYIVLDESQDISKLLAKFILSIAKAKKYKIIIVGDNNQKIYGFLGNINLSDVTSHIYRDRVIQKKLTKSFRFQKNSEMESLSNRILNLRYETIIGSRKSLGTKEREAYISRNKFPLLAMAIYQIKVNKDYHLLGGIDNFNKTEIKDIYTLYLYTKNAEHSIPNFKSLDLEKRLNRLLEYKKSGETPFPKIETKSLQPFSSFLDLVTFAESRAIFEIIDNINVALFIHSNSSNMSEIKNFEYNAQNLVEQFFAIIEKSSNPESKTTLSTIHKTKGLEFEHVTILKPLSIFFNENDNKWQMHEPSSGHIIGLTKESIDFKIRRESVSNKELSDIFHKVGNAERNVFNSQEKKNEVPSLNIDDIKSNSISNELIIDMRNTNIKEEYNILYVAITRAINSIQISNLHYTATLEFLDFVNRNLDELIKITNGKDSYLLETIFIRNKPVSVIIYKDSFLTIETLKEFLPLI
jgi:superfamily I DNA/RNA helicase